MIQAQSISGVCHLARLASRPIKTHRCRGPRGCAKGIAANRWKDPLENDKESSSNKIQVSKDLSFQGLKDLPCLERLQETLRAPCLNTTVAQTKFGLVSINLCGLFKYCRRSFRRRKSPEERKSWKRAEMLHYAGAEELLTWLSSCHWIHAKIKKWSVVEICRSFRDHGAYNFKFVLQAFRQGSNEDSNG